MMQQKERRKVTFSDSVKTQDVPGLAPEEVANLFYSKHDFRIFKDDQLLQQDKHVSKAIRRLIEDNLDDLEDRMAHAEKVQDIEIFLLNHSKTLSREIKIGESRGASHNDDAMHDEALRLESLRLDQEREQKSEKQQTDMTRPFLYTETREFHEISSMLEDSCSSLLNFQPIDFEPELGPSLGVSAM